MDCEEVKQHLEDYLMSPTLSTWSYLSDCEIDEQPMQGSEPTVDRKSSKKQRKPRVPQSQPQKRNILFFWLKKFKSDYMRRQGVNENTPRILQTFLTDQKSCTPTVNIEKDLFEDLDFFTAVKTWFDREGKSEVQRAKVRDDWKLQYFCDFQKLLEDYGDHHSSMEAQKRDSKGSHSSLGSQKRDSGSYLLAAES